jgi:hypothetical protein
VTGPRLARTVPQVKEPAVSVPLLVERTPVGPDGGQDATLPCDVAGDDEVSLGDRVCENGATLWTRRLFRKTVAARPWEACGA